MKNNVRYLLNWGLAFDETRILKRFEELAEEEADYYAIFVPSLMMSVAYWIRMRKIRLEGDCHD